MEVLPPTRDPHPFYHEQSLTSGYTTQDGPERSSNAQQTCTPNQHELWNKTVMLSRGRAPGDPHTRTVIFPCQDIEDLRTHLGDHLANPNPEYPPAHTTVEMIFPISAAFTVTNPFAENQPGPKLAQAPLPMLSVYGTPNSTVISLVEAMTPMPDPRDNMKKQRVIAKACLEAIQRADGNRYSFHNNWWSKEDEAYRFSYFCNDSILNKSRSAAGGAATIGQKVVKPVYDCKGVLAVKFSAAKQSLQVQYKHVPVHKSYEERAPRPRPGSVRYKLAELYNPESLEKQRKPKSSKKAASSGDLKRKRQGSGQTATDTHDEDPAMESISPLNIPEGDRPTTTSSPTRDPSKNNAKKPKCTTCNTKNVKTSENSLFDEAETTAQPLATRPESVPTPADLVPGPTAHGKHGPQPRAAAATEKPKRDIQKELREAMGEFDMLMAKLAEVEERIKRLEAEKEPEGPGSALLHVKPSTYYALQTQTEWTGFGVMRPIPTAEPTEHQPAAQDACIPRRDPA